MRRLTYLSAARNDLIAIFDYVTRESGHVTVGQSVIARLRSRCTRIASLPGILGTDRSELAPELRSVAERNYVIYFRYRDNIIEIVTILHASRDVAPLIARTDRKR